MKKVLTAIALAAVIGIFSQSAEAFWGNGPRNGGPGRCGNCDQSTPIDPEARQTFFDETQDLRTQLRENRTAYFTLLNSENPDKEAAQSLWSEMFDLQQQIQEKAAEAGFNPDTDRIAGNGRGCGSFRGGNGPAGCDGQGCAQYTNNTPTE